MKKLTDDMPLEGKALAQAIHDFLETRLGQHLLTTYSLEYNGLHQSAERKDLTIEQKALSVERAAGVKYAITYLTERDGLLQTGYYDKDTPATNA